MSGFALRVFLKNSLRALFFIFPLLLLTVIVTSRLAGDVSDDWATASAFYLFAWGIPIVGAAMLHQVLFLALMRLLDVTRRPRLVAVFLVVVFPLVFLIVGSSSAVVFHPRLLVPVLVGGVLYASTMDLGSIQDGSTTTA